MFTMTAYPDDFERLWQSAASEVFTIARARARANLGTAHGDQ